MISVTNSENDCIEFQPRCDAGLWTFDRPFFAEDKVFTIREEFILALMRVYYRKIAEVILGIVITKILIMSAFIAIAPEDDPMMIYISSVHRVHTNKCCRIFRGIACQVNNASTLPRYYSSCR